MTGNDLRPLRFVGPHTFPDARPWLVQERKRQHRAYLRRWSIRILLAVFSGAFVFTAVLMAFVPE